MKSPDRDAADEREIDQIIAIDNAAMDKLEAMIGAVADQRDLAFAALEKQASELATLRRRVDALECALRPFAQYAEGFGPHAREDGWVIATRPSGTKPLTMGHVREALLVLSPPTRKE